MAGSRRATTTSVGAARRLPGIAVLAVAAVAIAATSPRRWTQSAPPVTGSVELAPGAPVTRTFDLSLPPAPRVAGESVEFTLDVTVRALAPAQVAVDAQVAGEAQPAPAQPATSARAWTSRRCPAAEPCRARVVVTLRRTDNVAAPAPVDWTAAARARGIGDDPPRNAAKLRVELAP